MEKIEEFAQQKAYFVFDLEFIGDVRNLETCQIWEIAVYCVHTQQWFDRVVDPDPNVKTFPPPPIPEIPQLTRDFLSGQKAKTWDCVYQQLVYWILSNSHGRLPIFISHNTFRADKPIIELECKRYGHIVPLDWYFFDSLHYSRKMIKNANGNYSLSGLHSQLFGAPIQNAHRARNDVEACIRIINHISMGAWNLTGPIYPSYSTSLRSIRWIGQKAENVLYSVNIRSVEQLILYIRANGRKDYIFSRMLYTDSIQKSLQTIMENKLPSENIKNISQMLQTYTIGTLNILQNLK